MTKSELFRHMDRAMAKSDDMRQMVDDIGEQLGPVAWRLKTDFGDMIVINPVNIKDKHTF